MKPNQSSNSPFIHCQGSMDRLSASSYEFLAQQGNRNAATAPSQFHGSRTHVGGGGRFLSPAAPLRSDYERYQYSILGDRNPSGSYGISERNSGGYPEHRQRYFPPGTHSVQSGYHPMLPEIPRQFRSSLNSLRSRERGTPYMGSNNGSVDPFFSDEEPLFPSWNSRDSGVSLPPIRNPRESFDMNFETGGGYSSPFLNPGDDDLMDPSMSMGNFKERLETFPHLPMDAHKRIFQMGNQIVDCFEVLLERFYCGSLLDSAPRCLAVFTKKERTGQRWLMVFKEDINRSVVKFNRLLTHSLLVRIQSPTAIEIEAAKALYGPPAEMCVLNFRNVEEAIRFNGTLHESQTTAWNHREVTHEQQMKTLFNRISAAPIERSEANTSHGMTSTQAIPQSRSPFTLGSLREPVSPRLTPTASPARQLSDLDHDWRNRKMTRDQVTEDPYAQYLNLGLGNIGESPIRKRTSNIASSHLGKFGNSDCLFDSMTHRNALRMDGSGDADTETAESDLEVEIPEVKDLVSFEVNGVTLLIKKNPELLCFEELGKGKLQIVDHGKSALDEIQFISGEGRRDEICSQFIFRWNTICKEDSCNGGGVTCKWTGTASLSSDPTLVPETREFKMDFQDNDLADKFIIMFRKGVERGCDPAVKKRHITWFVKNRGHSFYK